jgi:ABC-2 type transport system permease protein
LKFGADVPHFPIYLLLGIVLWNFFNEMTVQSLGSIVGRADLIRKIRIPRWIIVLSSSISALINLGLNLLVVLVFVLLSDIDVLKSVLWLPLILLEIYLFALGISLFLSAAFVKYRDVGYIWDVVLQAGFYLTPIIYPLSKIADMTIAGISIQGGTILKFMLINPMAQAIQDARYVAITPQTQTIHQAFHGGWYRFIPIIMVVVVLIGGLLYFRKQAKYFAENI